MKRDDIQKLKGKNTAELEKDLVDSRERLGVLLFDLASGKVKNNSEIRDLKKKIARTLSFLKEKPNQS
ncbi:MAG: 50S ribosomal protein L29 [Candidatus Colwellbacteria bacterium]